jgi:hypothetical protein
MNLFKNLFLIGRDVVSVVSHHIREFSQIFLRPFEHSAINNLFEHLPTLLKFTRFIYNCIFLVLFVYFGLF